MNHGKISRVASLSLMSAAITLIVLSACNGEPVYSVSQAPGYPGQYPTYPGQPNQFNPVLPQGQQPQYTPFVPIDCYMNQNPQLYQYWQTMWQDWQGYSQHYGINQYDFSAFWFDYCPQQWQGTQYQEIYTYLDTYFYSWMTPQTQFSPYGYDAAQFWGGYQQFPMQPWNGGGYGY